MKYLLTSLILLAGTSIAYAGGSCCSKGDSKDKEAGKSGNVETTAIVAGYDCGGDKDGKDCGDKANTAGLSSYLAGYGCGGDKDGKSCGGEKRSALDAVLA